MDSSRFLCAVRAMFISTVWLSTAPVLLGQSGSPAPSGVAALTPGVISTIAGNGIAGFSGEGGTATGAELNLGSSTRNAVDTAGNLYIVDAANNRIRKVSPAGVITTVVGTGTGGYSGDGGQATLAQIDRLGGGIVVDAAGNLYFTQFDCIRKVTPAGIISTIAGSYSISGFYGDNGPATSAFLNGPGGLAIDTAGDLFIADTGNNRIREILTNGTITTVAGSANAGFSGDGGLATSAELLNPSAVAVYGSTLYIADSANNRVRAVVVGTISTVAGTGIASSTGDGQLAATATLDQPAGIATDGAGNYYITEYGSGRIRKVNAAGYIATVAGSSRGFSGDGSSALAAQLENPTDIALDLHGNLYIADPPTERVRLVIVSQTPALIFATTQTSSISNDSPKQVTVSNVGNAALSIAGLSISKNFDLVSGSTGTTCAGSSTLNAGADCVVAISFEPVQSGNLTGAATLTDDSLGIAGSTQSIALSGTGLQTFTQLAIGGLPSDATVGTQAQFTVTAEDTSHNPVNAYTGTISFSSTDSSATLPASYTFTASDAGVHTFNVTFRAAGAQTITARDAAANISITSGVVSVTSVAAPSVTLGVTPTTGLAYGQTVTLTAMESPAESFSAGYTWSLLDGTTELVSGAISNTPNGYTMTSPALTAGQHSFTAVYSSPNSGMYPTGTSNTVTVTVAQATPDFSIAANPSSLSIRQGQSATATISVMPVFGFNQAISLTCSGLPAGASCNFSPATLQPNGTTASSLLTITTTAATGALQQKSPWAPLSGRTTLAMLFGSIVLWGATKRRKQWILVLILSCIGSLVTGCGSGPVKGNVGTPTGTSQATVTAAVSSANGVSHEVSLSITITD